MAQYKSNAIILSSEERKQIAEDLDLITSPLEWIKVIEKYFALANFNTSIIWNPTFKLIKDGSNVIPAFVGNISGKNIDLTGKNRQVYSLSLGTGWSDSSTLRWNSLGGGGGGTDWSYQSAYIDIRRFPAMVNKYGTDITQATIQTEQLKYQLAFDYEVSKAIFTLRNISTKAERQPSVNALAKQISLCEQVLEKLKQSHRLAYASESCKLIKKENIVIPTTDSAFIDLSKYNQLISIINDTVYGEVNFPRANTEAQRIYETFVNNNPEYFI